MEKGVIYIVTKSSDDGSFEIGDHISLLDDGAILCKESGGWIDPDDILEATKGMETEIDIEWLRKRRDKLLLEVESINKLLS